MYGEAPVSYHPSIRQLVPHLVVVGLVLVASIVLRDASLTVIAVIGLVAVLVMWRRFGTLLRHDGIVLLGLTSRFVPWSRVEDVAEHTQFGGRGVFLKESDGRRTLLKAPRDGRLAPDPDYEDKRDRILRYWRTNR
jgi:hypothetical protein